MHGRTCRCSCCAGVKEDDRPPPAGLLWPAPPTVATAKSGAPKWAAMPIVLVDTGAGRESRANLSSSPSPEAAAELLGADTRGRGGGGGGGSTSYANRLEAELAVAAVYALCAAGDVDSVALLTPYRGQVRRAAQGLCARAV